ncbi:DNA-3-methyladenine glycosylase [soil metagenome]
MSTRTTPRPVAVDLPVSGRFSLAAVAGMGFGHRHEDRFDGTMRLAFCLDSLDGHGAVEVRQDGDRVQATVVAGPPDAVAAQTARILSLDHDGVGFDAVGRADPVIGRLQALAPGLRPPLFHSPYEAAAWAVLSARRPARQMIAVRRRLGEEHGATFELAGQPTAAFPTPAQLLGVSAFAGLDAIKVERLHAVARAALDGQLDVDRLRAMEPEAAMADLRSIPGIGPFYATLVVVRATGLTDVLASEEPRLLAAIGERYELGHPATPAELAAIAGSWRPFRTWASVLVRATAGLG